MSEVGGDGLGWRRERKSLREIGRAGSNRCGLDCIAV